MKLTVLWAALLAGPVAAAASGEPDTRRVVAGERFRASGFHRFLFGDNYRDLWTLPVELPVLDLKTFAGGLTPVRKLGHGQTKALALRGADGRSYTFRGVLKDPIGLLPEELRATLAGRLVRDQMSSQHPASHVVVPVLQEALGLLHNVPELVVLPDDEALGPFRAEFAGAVGDIEEYTGAPGFAGAAEVIDGPELWKRTDESPATRIDARAFLRARLLDHLVGDWDRHREQWNWARFEGQPLWQPIAEDRDQAFVRFEGFALSFLRPGLPLLMSYGPEYPSLEGLLFDSWDVDRRLLAGLERPDWEEAAREVAARLTDEVLERAVRRLPAAYFEQVGTQMLAGLRGRRARLAAHARDYYLFLARQADVRGTAAAEQAEIERLPAGDVRVSLAALGADGTPAPAHFTRVFRHGETREVRLLLGGGDDRVIARGTGDGVRVRVAGGAGDDRVDDAAGAGLRVVDHEGRNEVLRGPGTRVDARVYTPPPPAARGSWIPARDWGRRTIAPVLRFTGSPELGVVANLGLDTTGYGFRKHPWADRQGWRASYSTGVGAFAGEYRGRFRRENRAAWLDLDARASGFDLVRFYGFGNETADQGGDDDDVHQTGTDTLRVAPAFGLPVGRRGELSFGPVLKYTVSGSDPDTLLGQQAPYGVGHFGQLGLESELTLSTTDRAGLPTRGTELSLGGAWYPAAWSVASAFGSVSGEASVYATRWATLSLSAGGRRVFGDYPYHEAAYLGGSGSVRGLRSQRYAGDGALFGQAELYLPLATLALPAPGQLGVFALADTGRVFLAGEDSRRWHAGYGGGIFFTSPRRNNTAAVAVGWSEGRAGFYFRLGSALQ